MLEKIQGTDWLPTFIKIFIPAFVGVGIKIAIEMKKDKTKVSLINIVLSMFIGISGAWLLSGMIEDICALHYVPAVIALVAIISDKIGEFIIYKLNIDVFLTALVNNAFIFVSNTFKKQ